MKLDTFHKKFNSDGFLNIRSKTLKLSEEIAGGGNLVIGLDNNFFYFILKEKATKANINKLEYTKLKIFCVAKVIINTIFHFKQPTEVEKIFVNDHLIRD